VADLYSAPVTISPPPLQVHPGYPEWDPIPRPPRYTASWLALLLVGGAGVAAVVGAGSVFGSRYAVRADVCQALDLGLIGAALGQPGLTAGAAGGPGGVDAATNRPERLCRFDVTQPDGARRAVGTVTATWYDNAFMGKYYYETRRAQADRPVSQESAPVDLTGLGDRAFRHHDDKAGVLQFRVAALDSNLMVDLQVAVGAGDQAWSAAQAGTAFTALTGAIRASLPRLR